MSLILLSFALGFIVRSLLTDSKYVALRSEALKEINELKKHNDVLRIALRRARRLYDINA